VDDATKSGRVDSVRRSIGSMVDVSGRACGIVYGGGVTWRRMRARALQCIGDVG
jgi:uridylate kinase